MQRWFLKIAYNGSPFHGWQRQKNAYTVQEELEKQLSVICRKNIEVTGCGRTDTGVHAKTFYLHFDIEHLPFNKELFLFKLNCLLPKSIAAYSLFRVHNSAHARFDAEWRTYQYQFIKEKNPFEADWCWQVNKNMDFEKMNEAAQLLKKHKNFASFCKSNAGNTTDICHIKEARFFKENHKIIFQITADRFLRNMVRAIVGTLADLGMDKISATDFEQIIHSKKRSAAGSSAPAHALFLTQITYPESIFIDEENS